MDDDTDYASTTTMTSVTEDTDDCSGVTGTGLDDDSSQVTVSDTNTSDEADETTILVSTTQVKVKKDESDITVKNVEIVQENVEVKMELTAETETESSIPNDSTPLSMQPTVLFTAPVNACVWGLTSSDTQEKQQRKNGDSSDSLQPPDVENSQGPWYQQDCFKPYWQHYHFVSLWCQKHMEVYQTVRQQYAKTLSTNAMSFANGTFPLASNLKPVYQQAEYVFKKPSVSRKTQRNRKARRRRKEMKKRMMMSLRSSVTTESDSSQAEKKERETTDVSMDEEVTDSTVEVTTEVHMEISEEMLNFFAHTHKHRLEREASKKSAKTNKEEKHVNIEEVRSDQKERTVEAPKEQPGSRRTAEMRLLYGKGAAMIHGMETALQMNFDRNLDVKQPKLWPNMPFKVIFNS